MITVNLTMGEAQAVADAIRELVERSEQNELVLGPIDWDDLRTADKKLSKTINSQSLTTMMARKASLCTRSPFADAGTQSRAELVVLARAAQTLPLMPM